MLKTITFKKNERKLNVLAKIAENNPLAIFCGSAGLWLHGVDSGFSLGTSDIDIALPYYAQIVGGDGLLVVSDSGDTFSGSDFCETYAVTATGEGGMWAPVKVETTINPLQKYTLVKVGDYKFKVSPTLDILTKKLEYANKGVAKHQHSIVRMLKDHTDFEKSTLPGKEDLPF